MTTNKPFILAGDIGGTKTNLAVFAEGDLQRPLAQATFASSDHADLESMVSEFLAGSGLAVQRAAFGVAGPVLHGRAKITKLTWVVDQEGLRARFALTRVLVVNDLVATAHGIAALSKDDLICLNQGVPDRHGPMAIIAPGTGLGEALMFWDGARYQAHATEGGHSLFSPASRQHLALADFLFDRHGAVSFDFIASGRGLPLIYDFLKHQGVHEEPDWLAEALRAGDPSPVITKAALDPGSPNPLCLDALRLLVEIIAVECRNLAFKSLSTGGLFIGGGIPPRIASVFADHFLPSFIGQGPLQGLLAAMPVQLITNPQTALLGAALLAGAPA
jgi:glucokinase